MNRSLFLFLMALISFNLRLAPTVSAAVPNAPTNFSASMLGANWIFYQWVDTSDNEEAFSIEYFNGLTWLQVAEIVPNTTFFNLILNDPLPGGSGGMFTWRIRSWDNVDQFSTSSNQSVTSNPSAVFNSPTGLTSTIVGDARVISWTDNSNQETGYTIEQSTSAGVWTVLGSIGPIANSNTNTSISLAGFYVPSSSVSIRVRALRSNPVIYSGYSNEHTFTIPVIAPPTNLAFTLPTPEQVNLTWTDNSSQEGNYEIQYRFGSTAAFQTLNYVLGNVTTYTVPGVPPEPIEFRVRATWGAGPDQFSAFSSIVSATTTLKAPTGLTATVLGEQTVKFDWTDNSAVEQGYIVQARFLPSGTFFDIAGTAVNAQTITVTAPNLPYPGLEYEFRVLAAYDPDGTGSAPVVVSAPSNAVTSNMAFNTPTTLNATLVNDTSVNFTWIDNSSVETKYSLLVRRVGSTTWGLLADTAANATSYSTTLLFPGTAYEFAVIGVFVRATNDVVETDLSNIVPITTPFTAPTNLLLQSGSLTETQATFTWTDNSTGEGGYEILSRPAGSSDTPTSAGAVGANVSTVTVPLTPGASLEFFVRGFYVRTNTPGDVAFTSNTNGVTLTAKDGVTSPLYVELIKDVPMSTYTLTQSSGSTLSTRAITGLPAGLTFDSNNGTVTGTPTVGGVVQSNVTLTFANGWTHSNKLVFRVLLPPVVAAFPAQNIALGTPAIVSLTGKFTDPDASSAARVNTNLTANGGNMDFILFDSATPLHVANFMGYATRGDYVNTVFHRTIAGFITQGGAFRADTAPTAFLAVPTQAQVTNEPGISNVRGTVALAKLGNQPSSGTNQFFVNLANNGGNLDFQNGGFTAFGRVTAPGMAVADAMATLPSGDYNVTVGGTDNVFEDFPFNAASAPATMNNTQAVKINSVTALPVLSYTLVSNSNPSVATASITGTDLSLTPIALGSTILVIRAIDLEGLTVEHSVSISVNGTYASWAVAEALPIGQDEMLHDADTDGTTNLEEWAFLSSPKSGSELGQPTPSLTPTGDPTGRIHFKARKLASGLTFIVQASETLESTDWVDIWNSSTDGYSSPRVTVDQDNADHRVLTVTDLESIVTGAPRRFLRVKLVQTP